MIKWLINFLKYKDKYSPDATKNTYKWVFFVADQIVRFENPTITIYTNRGMPGKFFAKD